MIIDGRAIAREVLTGARASVTPSVPVVRAVVVRPSPSTESYLKTKTDMAHEAGMELEVVRLADDADDEAVIAAVIAPGADSTIVQLPLPKEFDLEKILAALPVAQDADVLSSSAYARFEQGEPDALVPPVAAAVREILERSNVSVAGKRVVVVGTGKLVGKPCATLLTQMGANVSVVTTETSDPATLYRDADIIVSGAGSPGIITPDLVRDGVVLIDAGTSGTSGVMLGDMDPACAEKASVFTPVPGGVGPVAVACLFKNTAQLFREKANLK